MDSIERPTKQIRKKDKLRSHLKNPYLVRKYEERQRHLFISKRRFLKKEKLQWEPDILQETEVFSHSPIVNNKDVWFIINEFKNETTFFKIYKYICSFIWK